MSTRTITRDASDGLPPVTDVTGKEGRTLIILIGDPPSPEPPVTPARRDGPDTGPEPEPPRPLPPRK